MGSRINTTSVSTNISSTLNQNLPVTQSDLTNPITLTNASNNKIEILDGDAIGKAFAFGTLAISKLSDLTVQFNRQVSENSTNAINAAVSATGKLNEAIEENASGYDWTKNRNLVFAGVAISLAWLYFRK